MLRTKPYAPCYAEKGKEEKEKEYRNKTREERTQPRYLVLRGSFDSCITEEEALLSKYHAIHLCPQAG